MKKFKDKIKQVDAFGYPIGLNYQNYGKTYKTVLGASCTILMFCLVSAFLVLLVIRMVYHQQDFISLNEQSIDLKKEGYVYYNQTNLKVFQWLLKDQIRSDLSIQELRKYLDIYYRLDFEDWYDNIQTSKRVEVKWCTQDDFGFDSDSEKIWNSWNNSLIICPDFKDEDSFYLQDDGVGMVFSHINIIFQKCNSSNPESICETDDVINDFLKDLQIITYTLQYNTDFQKYNKAPVYKYQEVQSIIYPITSLDLVQVDNLYIRKNQVTTQDAYLQYGQISEQFQFYDVANTQQYNAPRNLSETVFARINLQLQGSTINIQRKIYSITNLLSDLGGVINSLIIILTIFLQPFSMHSFTLEFLQQMYFETLQKENFFKNKIGKKPQKSFSSFDYIYLFMYTYGCKCFMKYFWKKYEKMEEFFIRESQALDQNLDIFTIFQFLNQKNDLLKPNMVQQNPKKDASQDLQELHNSEKKLLKERLSISQILNQSDDQLKQVMEDIKSNFENDQKNDFAVRQDKVNDTYLQQQYEYSINQSKQISNIRKNGDYFEKESNAQNQNADAKNNSFKHSQFANDFNQNGDVQSVIQDNQSSKTKKKNIQRSISARKNIFAQKKKFQDQT